MLKREHSDNVVSFPFMHFHDIRRRSRFSFFFSSSHRYSGVSGFLPPQSPATVFVPPSSYVTCCEVMSDVTFLGRLASLGVYWRIKEAL